jgi:hypothetical protein
MKLSNQGFPHEAHAKVAYVLGEMSNQLPYMDWDDVMLKAESIVIRWQNHVDIQNEEEKAYIMSYARRILLEN